MPTLDNTSIASNEVMALFPTVVCRTQLEPESGSSLNQAINARIDALINAEEPLAAGERCRTGDNLHSWEEISPLAEFVLSNAEGMLSYLLAVHDGIEITACWADVRGPGARRSEGSDVNTYLGAVYFSRVADGETRVSFRDPRRQAGILALPFGGDDHSEVLVREGTLLLFPAWLEHGIARNESETPSVSIGFNLMFKNFTEVMSKPLWEGNTYKRA